MWKIYNEDVQKYISDGQIAGEKYHALICDPPYNLDTVQKRFGKPGSAPAKFGKDGSFQRLSSGFLGTDWDTDIAFDPRLWYNLGTLLHPGAIGMSYTHARTYHRIASAIEEAGFIIHPMIGWINAQGFPHPTKLKEHEGYYYNRNALKGALEPIVVFQNPYEGTLKENILKTGSGAFWIDGARIPTNEEIPINILEKWSGFGEMKRPGYKATINKKGRWPSNILVEAGIGQPYERFFFVSKPSPKEKSGSKHPTIKPIDLNTHLATMLLPPDSFQPRRLLNPFSGSGSEIIGALQAGWDEVTGIELNQEYTEMAEGRIDAFINKNRDRQTKGT